MLKHDRAVDGTPISELGPGSEKKVVLVCDICGKETVTGFCNYIRGQHPGRNGETFCKTCATRKSGLAKRGKPIKAVPKKNRASNHGGWKGGRWVGSDGYVQVYIGPKKYRKEHFLVMEQHLGRLLEDGERVHHIDGNKQNNWLYNLALLEDESAHQDAHRSLYEWACYLVRVGAILYSREANRYYMAMDKLRELLEQPEEANQQPSLSGDALEGSTTR